MICLLSCIENCQSFEVRPNRKLKRLELKFVPRKCLHYYFYMQHPRFGFMHVRFQSWFPFDVRVCMNGREWLCRELDRAGVGYVRRENCLTDVADIVYAQRLLGRQARINWTNELDAFAALVHPLRREIFRAWPVDYYWSLDESEWASDVMFRSPRLLAELYPGLVRHAIGRARQPGRDAVLAGRKVPAYWRQSAVSEAGRQRFETTLLEANDCGSNIGWGTIPSRCTTSRVPCWVGGKRRSTIPTTSRCVSARRREIPEEIRRWLRLSARVWPTCSSPSGSLAGGKINGISESLAATEQTTPLAELTASFCKPTRYRGRSVRSCPTLWPRRTPNCSRR